MSRASLRRRTSTARVHLKIDTGLHRNGIRPERWDAAVSAATGHQRSGAISRGRRMDPPRRGIRQRRRRGGPAVRDRGGCCDPRRPPPRRAPPRRQRGRVRAPRVPAGCRADRRLRIRHPTRRRTGGGRARHPSHRDTGRARDPPRRRGGSRGDRLAARTAVDAVGAGGDRNSRRARARCCASANCTA